MNNVLNESKGTFEDISLTGSPVVGLVAGTVAFFSGFASIALFGASANTIAPLVHLSIIEVGWLVAVPIVTGSLLRIPFSAMVDRFGGKIVLTAQLLISLAGLMGLIFSLNLILSGKLEETSTSFILLVITGGISGTGISTFSSGITYVSYWYPLRKQGFALGFYGGLGNTAPAIFTIIIPVAILSLGLLNSYIAWALFLLIGILIFHFIGSDSYYFQISRKKGRSAAIEYCKSNGFNLFPAGSAIYSITKAMRNWKIWLLVVMYMVSFGGFEALTVWLPTYWSNYLDFSSVTAGFLTGFVFSLVTAVSRIPGGWISDRAASPRVAFISYAMVTAGSAFIMNSSSAQDSVIALLIIAVGMGVANAVVYKLIPLYFGSSIGGASGLVGGLGSAGGLIIPPTMAEFVRSYGHEGYPAGFAVFLALGIVAMVFSLVLLKLNPPEARGS